MWVKCSLPSFSASVHLSLTATVMLWICYCSIWKTFREKPLQNKAHTYWPDTPWSSGIRSHLTFRVCISHHSLSHPLSSDQTPSSWCSPAFVLLPSPLHARNPPSGPRVSVVALPPERPLPAATAPSHPHGAISASLRVLEFGKTVLPPPLNFLGLNS